jgi:hypothetical protein
VHRHAPTETNGLGQAQAAASGRHDVQVGGPLSLSYTAMVDIIAGEDTAVVAPDTAFNSRFRTS